VLRDQVTSSEWNESSAWPSRRANRSASTGLRVSEAPPVAAMSCPSTSSNHRRSRHRRCPEWRLMRAPACQEPQAARHATVEEHCDQGAPLVV